MEKITVSDLYEERFIENLIASPGRNSAVFSVARANESTNGYDRNLYLYKDDTVSQLTYDNKTSLLSYDDEDHILVIKKNREKAGQTVIHRLSLTGGEAEPYLFLPLSPAGIERIRENFYVFTATIDRNAPDAYLDTKENIEKNVPDGIEESPYCTNGQGITSGKRTALFTLTKKKESWQCKRITSATFDVEEFKTRAGDVYYIGNAYTNRKSPFSKLYVYHTQSGKNEGLYTKANLSLSNLFFLQNDFYLQASDLKEYGINETPHLCRYQNNEIKLLFKPEVQLQNTVFTDIMLGGGKQAVAYNNHYYTLATTEDHTELWEYDAEMKKKVLFSKPGAIFFFEIVKDRILFARATSDSLTELYSMTIKGESVRRLTYFHKEFLQNKYIAKPHRISYQSQGYDLHGWVLLPENYDKRKSVPGILEIHGGPRVCYGELFSHEMQCFLAKGYAVFFTNIKGSDGRGDAFADIRDDYGNTDYQNLMDFTDAVVKHYPKIDETRLNVTGGSYGGFMTNWIITHTRRFVSAVSQRSISNWLTFSLLSDIGMLFGPDQCGALSIYETEDLKKLWDHSPLKYSANVQTPTLFLHSDEDYRCPKEEGIQMMQALTQRNVDTRLVLFHEENHELSRSGKPFNRIYRLKEMLRWFDTYSAPKRIQK